MKQWAKYGIIMNLKRLELYNYRNYEKLTLNFEKNNTIFIGNNAQGKTNILESIYVLGLTKSFFNINEKNLIKFGCLYSKIYGEVVDNDKEHKLEIIINEKGKKVKIDNQEVNKLSNYISKLNVIVFSPDNIRVLKESPNYRRKYLNIEISQLYSNYIVTLNNFNKILKQRNEYLKTIINEVYDTQYISVLNEKYVELAINVYRYRKDFIDKINENLSEIYFKISGFRELQIKYISSIEYDDSISLMKEKFLKKLNSNLNTDIKYKLSLLGPQRDDFQLELNGKNILLYGSQGQVRCSILALKFAEIPIFNEILNKKPILLLDDIFSELDFEKKNLLIEYLSDDMQTIITTTDLESINKNLIKKAKVFTVKNGSVLDV